MPKTSGVQDLPLSSHGERSVKAGMRLFRSPKQQSGACYSVVAKRSYIKHAPLNQILLALLVKFRKQARRLAMAKHVTLVF